MPLSPAPRPAGKRTVAAFDFDGTLTSGGSVLPFLVAVRGFVAGAAAPWSRSRPSLLRSALVGGTAADAAKEKLFTRLLGGLPVAGGRGALRGGSRSAIWPATCDRTPGCACSGTSARGTTWSSSPPPRSATCAGPASSSGSTVSWPPVWPSAGADSSPATTRGRTAGGRRSTPGWSSISGPTDCSAAASDQPELWAYGNSRGDLRLLRAADHGIDAGLLGPLGRLRKFPRLADVVRESEARRSAGAGGNAHHASPSSPVRWTPRPRSRGRRRS